MGRGDEKVERAGEGWKEGEKGREREREKEGRTCREWPRLDLNRSPILGLRFKSALSTLTCHYLPLPVLSCTIL